MSRYVLVNVLVMLVLVLAATTVIGLIVFWPDGDKISQPAGSKRPKTQSAEVVGVRSTRCAQVTGLRDCFRVDAKAEERA